MRNPIYKKQQFYLIAVYALLAVASLSIEPNDFYLYFRGLRSVVGLTFLVWLFLFSKNFNGYLAGFCLMYSLSSFLTIWFENYWVSVAAMLVNSLAVLFLIKMVYQKIRLLKMSKTFLIAMIIVGLVNLYICYMFLELLYQSLDNAPLFIAICVVIIVFFTLLILTFIYNYESNTSTSIVFIFFVIFLIFAELFRGVGYYNFIDSVSGQYVARVLLISSFILLSFFSKLEAKKTPF